ncbi:MAG: signal recognition particle protein [Deltaproteobacteria bacterium]|nr:signal recognition particle protein [Deltaproteobacteria bacterium]
MLEVLTKGFRSARAKLQGKTLIGEAVIEEALKDIRMSLLEADVALPVVNAFLGHVKEKAIGEVVQLAVKGKAGKREISPAEHFIKLCNDELIALMGDGEGQITFAEKGQPTGIMLVGLHGTGKTTTAGKLARLLKHDKHRPLLVAADIYRPAAVDQLKVLGERVGVPVFHREDTSPPDLCAAAMHQARQDKLDVVIFDTAGRLTIDQPLMEELSGIRERTRAGNILLVVDAMIGQDAVRMASEFDKRLDLTGVVLTKMDGDARGGAALSVKAVTGKPVTFVGMGEDLSKLEPFRPDGLASRILGFGDVVGLVKDFEKVVDEEKAEEDALKILKGEFNLYQFLDQIRSIQKMGSLRDTMEKLPFFHEMVPEGATVDENVLVRIEAMINSMTPEERTKPEVIDENRIKRIAKGSGRKYHEVKDLLQRFGAMREVMRRIGKQPSLLSRLPGFKQALDLAKSRGEDVSDLMPDEGLPEGEGWGVQGPRRLSAAEKNKRRKKQKQARKQRRKGRKGKRKK